MFLSRKPEILARAVRAVFVLMLSLSTLFVQAQQIDLSLNDEKLLAGESILIPVNTSEILESDAVIAGEFEFSFNDDVVDITGVETSGTILENEGSTNYFEGTDRFSFAAPDTISGSGVLFYLKATANPNASYFDRTDFDIVSAMLNEGNPGVSITNAEANVEIKGVRINPDNNIDVIEGETLQFNLQDDFQAPITWEVSNPAIASISSNGLLSANAVGNIQVKATDAQGLKDSTEIFRIQPANLQNLNVSIPDTSEQQTKIIDVPVKVSDVSGLQIKSVQLDVRFNNLYLDLQEVLHAGTKTDTWGDPTVNIDADGVEIASAGTAALDGSGNLFLLRFKVTGERTGNSNVEFQEAQFNEELIPNFQNGSFEVEPAPSIEIFPADTAVSIGNQLQFQVTGGNGTPPYTWMVDDNSIATIDGGTGTLEGVSRGEVSVNVTDSEGFSSELVQVQVNSFDAYIDTVESINPDTVEMSLNTADLSSHNILSYEAGFRYNTDKLDFIGLNPAQTQSAGLNIEVKDSADVIRVVAAATSAISGQGPIIKFMFKAKQSVNDGDELKFDLKYLRFNEPGPTVPTTTPIPGYLNVTLIAPPSAPTLQAPSDGSADTDTTLSLEWAEVTEADEYQVQVSKDQNFSTLWLNQITTQTLQELSTLDFSTTYYWRVRSLNAGGESNWSSTYSFTTYDGLTEAIDLVEPADGVEDISIDDITFSWNAATLADGYQWQVSSQSDFSSFVRDSSGISSTSVITSLDYGTQYYWRVRGVNAQGNGSWSTTHTFSTQIAPPDTPVPFDPGDGAGQQDTVLTLKWLETARADSFKLQVSEVNDFSTVLIAETVNDTSNTIHGLEYTSQYYWRVKAFNTTGESNWSTEFSFTTREPDATIPSLNSPANNASDLDTALTLTWSDAENADSYQVQVSTQSDFSSLEEETSGHSSTSLDIVALSYSTTYYWRVRASNSSGFSGWSPTFSFTTRVPDSEVPVLSSPADQETEADTSLTLEWNTAENADSYHIQLSLQSDFSSFLIDSSSHSQITFDVDGLAHLTTYYWRVRSTNASGESSWSQIFEFQTKEKENRLPVVTNSLGERTLDEDFNSFDVAVLDTVFTDPEGESLNFEITKYDTTLFTPSLSADTLKLTSVSNAFGSGSVTVKATDNEGADILDVLNITVAPVNDTPQINNIPDSLRFNNDEDITFTLDTSIVDVEDLKEDLQVEVTADEDDIDVSLDEDLLVTVSAPDFVGEGTLTITVTDGGGAVAEAFITIIVETSVSNELNNEIPVEFALRQNYPNPFNPSTNIRYHLPEAADVEIEVFSMLGQKVTTLVDERKAAGKYQVSFEAGKLSSGMYIYRIRAGNFQQTRKMMLIK